MTHRINSCAARGMRPKHQRGMVTIVVMLFLIATVVFALSQMLDVSTVSYTHLTLPTKRIV